jgi:hypothetical protein
MGMPTGSAPKMLTRLCTSLDGCVTTPDGRPVQLAFGGWDAGALGFYEFQGRCEAVLMGRDHRHALLRPSVQVTPGAPFHDYGVPHVSGIAGPTYLLVVSDNGEMEKLDERLASRQIAFYADVIRRLDRAGAEELRTGDPTLGANPSTYRD